MAHLRTTYRLKPEALADLKVLWEERKEGVVEIHFYDEVKYVYEVEFVPYDKSSRIVRLKRGLSDIYFEEA